MRTRLGSSRAILGGAAIALTAVLMPGLHLPGDVALLLAFIAFIAAGELLEVSLPWGSSVTMGVAPVVGFMLGLDCAGPKDAARDCALNGNGPAEVAFVFAAGAVLALGIRALRGKDLHLDSLATQAITVVTVSVIYAALASVDPRDAFGPAHISYLGILGVFVAAMAVDALIPSVATALSERIPLMPLVRARLRASAALQMALVSVGSLLALAEPVLGGWAFPLFLVPLAATQYSFRQFASIRTTYLQTISALAKVPEMAGYTTNGHSSRVAEMSVEIAQEMGVPANKIEEIQYAALLHDIGRVSLPDPNTPTDSTYRLELALSGAAIVDETGYLPDVAAIIRQQNEPYRRRGEDLNRELKLGAKIIKVASAFDDLAYPGGLGRTPWNALERMHLGMAYEFDPSVIQALTRVLEKRGSI